MTEKTKDAFKCGTIELIANQIHDRLPFRLITREKDWVYTRVNQ